MKTIYPILLLLIIPIYSLAQNFELRAPNIEALTTELIETNYERDVIYLYLKENYKIESEKYEVENYDSLNSNICAFKQKFERGIIYIEEQCGEAKGLTVNFSIPKVNKHRLMRLIEILFDISSDGFENKWNEDKTKFEPTDKGAGCYYEIIETKSGFEVHMHCGC